MRMLWGPSIDEATAEILTNAYRRVCQKLEADRDLSQLLGEGSKGRARERLIGLVDGGQRDPDVLAIEALSYLRQTEQIRRSSLRSWKMRPAQAG